MLTLLHGDCLSVLQLTIPDNSVDAIVTDPPYGLSFMGKKWDYDVPSTELWAECLRVLKPGGHLLAFAGTRTQHRMAVRIEDAGFDIRDMIAWVYGSGFPKSLNLDGAHEGWGTALKPALEPITLARKPFKGTLVDNVAAHGTGAVNIAGCRIGEDVVGWGGGGGGQNSWKENGMQGDGEPRPVVGRWPANLIHDGSDEVVAAFPARAGAAAPVKGNEPSAASVGNVTGKRARVGGTFHGDTGGAARFFYCAKASAADRNEGCELLPVVQPHEITGRKEGSAGQGNPRAGIQTGARANHHPTVKPTALMRYLCRLVTPPGGVVLDPFMGSGSTGKAALAEGFQFIGIERDAEYMKIAQARTAAAVYGDLC